MNRIATTQLGTNGPVVGVQGLGCMDMTSFYGESDPASSRDTLSAAFDAGVTLYDTADVYSFGKNEEFVAPFLRSHRDDITITTKFGFAEDEMGGTIIRNDRAHIRRSVESSLRRLGVDEIDIYYMHRRDPEMPLARSIGAMAELVQEGKVKYLGLSEVSGDELREAHAIHPITAVQQKWSLFSREVEETLIPAASELGVGLVAHSPLGRGFLAGGVDASGPNEAPGSSARIAGENARTNVALLAPVYEIAAARGVSTVQIALAWVHQRAQIHDLTVVPIPGTRKPRRLLENLAATSIALTSDELCRLESIASQVVGAGVRT